MNLATCVHLYSPLNLTEPQFVNVEEHRNLFQGIDSATGWRHRFLGSLNKIRALGT